MRIGPLAAPSGTLLLSVTCISLGSTALVAAILGGSLAAYYAAQGRQKRETLAEDLPLMRPERFYPLNPDGPTLADLLRPRPTEESKPSPRESGLGPGFVHALATDWTFVESVFDGAAEAGKAVLSHYDFELSSRSTRHFEKACARLKQCLRLVHQNLAPVYGKWLADPLGKIWLETHYLPRFNWMKEMMSRESGPDSAAELWLQATTPSRADPSFQAQLPKLFVGPFVHELGRTIQEGDRNHLLTSLVPRAKRLVLQFGRGVVSGAVWNQVERRRRIRRLLLNHRETLVAVWRDRAERGERRWPKDLGALREQASSHLQPQIETLIEAVNQLEAGDRSVAVHRVAQLLALQNTGELDLKFMEVEFEAEMLEALDKRQVKNLVKAGMRVASSIGDVAVRFWSHHAETGSTDPLWDSREQLFGLAKGLLLPAYPVTKAQLEVLFSLPEWVRRAGQIDSSALRKVGAALTGTSRLTNDPNQVEGYVPLVSKYQQGQPFELERSKFQRQFVPWWLKTLTAQLKAQ